ncbi:MAG: hypothetical protein ACQCN4_00550 [Candidatus Bathyarchaeia archaeon]|jgi:Leu/Phe-tRNA-protein transferase
MSDFYFYKGLYKVKILTESEGYWLVEAQEAFEDYLNGEKVHVSVGEQRIVQPNELHKTKILSPPFPEHVYELKLEKKVKRLIQNCDKKDAKL